MLAFEERSNFFGVGALSMLATLIDLISALVPQRGYWEESFASAKVGVLNQEFLRVFTNRAHEVDLLFVGLRDQSRAFDLLRGLNPDTHLKRW